MCKKTNYKSSNVRIDKCIRLLIKFVQRCGYDTVASCCGHCKYPLTIVCKRYGGYRGLVTYELFTNVIIPRKRRFYKRDKKGYFYIPEVEEHYKRIKETQLSQTPKKNRLEPIKRM